jgi:MFS family permease
MCMIYQVITSVANSISASAMPLIMKDTYHMNEVNLGYILSSMSAFSAIVNGLLLGPITQLVGGNVTIVIETCIFSMTGIFLMLHHTIKHNPLVVGVLVLQSALASPMVSSMSLYNGLVEYMVLLFILNMFQFVLATALTGESTSRVGPNSKGVSHACIHSWCITSLCQ